MNDTDRQSEDELDVERALRAAAAGGGGPDRPPSRQDLELLGLLGHEPEPLTPSPGFETRVLAAVAGRRRGDAAAPPPAPHPPERPAAGHGRRSGWAASRWLLPLAA